MAEPFRVGFVPGVSPGKWLRTWSARPSTSPLEALPVDVADQRDLLLAGDLDMCFVRLPIDRADLHVIPLYAEVPVVVTAKEHPVAAFDEVDVADLAGEHLLQATSDVPEWADVADDVRDGTRVTPPPMTLAQAVEVAASGAGIVITPMSLARLHHRKDVIHRPVTGVSHSQVGLAWLVGNEDPRVEMFIGVVRGRTENSSRGPAPEAGGSDAARRRDGGGPDGAGRRDRAGAGSARRAGGRSTDARGRGGPSRGPAPRGKRGGRRRGGR